MSTQAQILANRANAQHSTGPQTEQGKAASSQNNFRHGFTGAFTVLPFENQAAYDQLFASLHSEHQPQTITEQILVEKMAQSHWLSKRAQRLQELIMGDENLASKEGVPERTGRGALGPFRPGSPVVRDQEKDRRFSLFLRYRTTNDRAFTRALHDLLKLRAEKRKARLDEAALLQRAEDVKIGFESQKQKEVAEARRAAAELRKQELHKHAVSLAEMKVFYQEALADAVETDKVIAQSLHQHKMESKKAA